MEITQFREGGFVVLVVDGQLDTKSSQEFERAVLELLTAGERRFVIDLGGLDHLAGAGLRVLLMLARKLSGTGGHLALCSLREPVRAAFDVAGFTSAFTICSSRADAIASAPSGTWSAAALQKAANALRVSRGSTGSGTRPPISGDLSLATRAASLLGVRVGTGPGKTGHDA
jgi:anti-anti-sigma factor